MSLAGQSISFSYGRTPVLDDVSLELRTRTVTAPPLVAQLNYGEPQTHAGRNRRDWSADLQAAVDALRQVQR